MSLHAAIAAELPFLREQAESRMVDTFDIKLPTGTKFDGTNDVTTYSPLFTTQGRVKVTGNVTQESEAGGRTVATVSRQLHIPVGSAAVPTDAVAVCVAVDDTSDPTLLGAVLRLDGPAPGSQTTARRLQVSEVLT